jgi:hypothetical protein
MGSSLRDQLAKLYPPPAPSVPPIPAQHPAYCTLDVVASYTRYCEEMAGKDFKDPREMLVSLIEENFPKLIGAKLKGTEKKAKAAWVLTALRNGTYNPDLYDIQSDRIETLFWIEDTICRCHSIHKNCRVTIQADEVYVKTYDKEGAQVKLVFTRQLQAGQIIVVTSFTTEVRDMPRFACMPPLWPLK